MGNRYKIQACLKYQANNWIQISVIRLLQEAGPKNIFINSPLREMRIIKILIWSHAHAFSTRHGLTCSAWLTVLIPNGKVLKHSQQNYNTKYRWWHDKTKRNCLTSLIIAERQQNRSTRFSIAFSIVTPQSHMGFQICPHENRMSIMLKIKQQSDNRATCSARKEDWVKPQFEAT